MPSGPSHGTLTAMCVGYYSSGACWALCQRRNADTLELSGTHHDAPDASFRAILSIDYASFRTTSS